MAAGSSGVEIDRKSSIEGEPRTLSFQQFQFAREAALYVINTRSFEEALQIFTEGLKSSENTERQDGLLMDGSDEEIDCCSDHFFRLPESRDIVTAPF
ncbi:hypothetical protein Nepgr_013217 [Nepenthes gracilis]|uniref:Uncharacterized protein n=1 Tax=Nepenthes gracilis TaxID=150966 RepID=A0AAD3SIK0_NEPGR|nr:hypothetical protein Nepgr_013217 [Nepenthes gracilis]